MRKRRRLRQRLLKRCARTDIQSRSLLAEATAAQVDPPRHSGHGHRQRRSHLGGEPPARRQSGRNRRSVRRLRVPIAAFQRRRFWNLILTGNLLKAWGGPDYVPGWPAEGIARPGAGAEHAIVVDRQGNVWLGGNARYDGIQKFTSDGKFLWDFGHRHPKEPEGQNTGPSARK